MLQDFRFNLALLGVDNGNGGVAVFMEHGCVQLGFNDVNVATRSHGINVEKTFL